MTKLKPSEKACLLLLMSEAREVSNTELRERYDGFSIQGADSRALVENGFATKRKGAKGALVHELTDEGWAQCKRELDAEFVKGAGPAYPALHALLGAVDRYLRRAELSLPDLFTASTPPPAPQPVAKIKPVVKRGLEKRVRDRVRQARRHAAGLGQPHRPAPGAVRGVGRRGRRGADEDGGGAHHRAGARGQPEDPHRRGPRRRDPHRR